jgi:hypothetical protein
MANEIADAIRSAGSLTAKLKSLEGMANYGELMGAATALQEKLSQALIANATSAEEKMALLERTQRLAEENEKLKDWNAKAQDYTLANVGHGAFAQVYKPQVQATKPSHWACTNCFEDKVVSVLQKKIRVGYYCPRCNLEISQHLLGNNSP